MEIIIKRPNNDDLLEQNSIKWKLFTKGNIILFVYAFMGIFFLVGNWLTLKDGENFWGFISSFGLSLIFLSLFYFSHICWPVFPHVCKINSWGIGISYH